MGKIIAIANQKGGVAKTLTARTFAAFLNIKGYKVLVVDGDPQGDATRQFSFNNHGTKQASFTTLIQAEVVNHRFDTAEEDMYDYDTRDAISTSDDGIDVLCSTNGLASAAASIDNSIMSKEKIIKTIVDQVKDDYDYIIIDSNPTLSVLTINVLTAADEVLIPTFAEEDPIVAIGKLVKTIVAVQRDSNPNLKINGILFTNVESRTNVAKYYMKELKDSGMFYIYDAFIPHGVSAKEVRSCHMSLFEYDKYGAVTLAYKSFGEEFLRRELGEDENIEDAKDIKEV